jgi:hypothetical protein
MDDLSHIGFGDACPDCDCDCGGCLCDLGNPLPAHHLPDCQSLRWDAASCLVAVVVGLVGVGATIWFAAMVFSPR